MEGMDHALEKLPLWAQVLVASRLLRRAALALQDRSALAQCDYADASAWAGECQVGTPPACTGPLHTAAEQLADATAAAQGAQSFPVDRCVTAGAQRCIDAICAVRGVNVVQAAILLGADLDQLNFACKEVGVGTYDGLGAHVRGRLAPVHALTIVEPAPTPEELCR